MAYMAEQIVDGMAFMHAKKQIHRDFKPCNVLVHHNGRVKISDFGVSAELDSSLVKCTTFVGTFLYMSPERFGSEPYSFPSDIWSLGLTLMQCATGEYPYLRNSGKTYWELMEVIVQKDAPTLPANGFSSGLETFLSSCLQKDPKSRPTAQVSGACICFLQCPWEDSTMSRLKSQMNQPCDPDPQPSTLNPVSFRRSFATTLSSHHIARRRPKRSGSRRLQVGFRVGV